MNVPPMLCNHKIVQSEKPKSETKYKTLKFEKYLNLSACFPRIDQDNFVYL